LPSLKAALPRVLKWLKRRGRSREDAEDLIQQACLRLHEYYEEGHAVVNEEAFLTGIIRNLEIDQYRRAQHLPYAREAIEELEQNQQIYDSGPAPDEVLDREQRLEIVWKALDERSVRVRDVFFDRLAGYSYKEIAAAYGISESAVEKNITRGYLTLMNMRVQK
jgi:RNA polymerase sigma factor (sigma-70 family)